MFLFIAMVIPFILQCILLFQLKRRAYQDKNYTKKIKIPLWMYLLCLTIALIPVVSVLFWIFICILFLRLCFTNDIYYKPGWIVRLLQKEL